LDVYALENACADAWPPLVERRVGDWRLRAANGFTGRANAALVTGDHGVDLAAALARVRSFAENHRIPPKLQVVATDSVERELTANGWEIDADHCGPDGVEVMVGALSPTSRRPALGAILDAPTTGWWLLAAGTSAPDEARRHVLGTVHSAGRAPLGFGMHTCGDDTVGAVRLAVVGEWLHISRLAVAESAQRGGVASGLLAAAARWGLRNGARYAVLQVTPGNTGAVRLYKRLGFTTHHRYRYWCPG
jgi:GNAT superfamily N-acetyltransferase